MGWQFLAAEPEELFAESDKGSLVASSIELLAGCNDDSEGFTVILIITDLSRHGRRLE